MAAKWGKDDLTGFYDAANEEALNTLAQLPAAHEALLEIDQAFRHFLTHDTPMTDPAIPALLGINAQSMLLAACRTAMSGHAVPTYVLLRGCLESALYSLHMIKNPKAEVVWLDRGKSSAASEACRTEFSAGRVKRTASETNEGLGSYVADAYEALLDFGAHPNVGGVMRHVRRHEGESAKVELAILHGHGPRKAEALVACIEVGLAALVALVEAFPERAKGIGLDAVVQKIFEQRAATIEVIKRQTIGPETAVSDCFGR